MLSAQLMKVAQNNQWKVQQEESMVFGEYNGYLFTVMDGKGFKAFFTSIAGISQEGLKAVFSWLDDNSGKIKLRNYETTDNFLCVRLQEAWLPLSAEKIELFLAQLSGMLDQFGLPRQACVICGESAEKRGLYYGLFCNLHPECQDQPGQDYGLIREPATDAGDQAAFLEEVAAGEPVQAEDKPETGL